MSKSTAFYRRTPPALFPCLLGFMGLGLAWRRFGSLGFPPDVGEIICFIATGLFLLAFAAFILKIALRPAVLLEDLSVPTARGAVFASSMGLMLLSAVLVPYSSSFAEIVMWMSLALHLLYVFCVVTVLRRLDNWLAAVSPVLLMPFVGAIVAGIAAAQLGYQTFAFILMVVTMPIYAAISVVSFVNAKRFGLKVPERSMFAILLAPAGIYAIVFHDLGFQNYAFVFWCLSLVIFFCMVPLIPWITKGGWKPTWGSFTFPLVAFSSSMINGVLSNFGHLSAIAMILSLGLASAIVPYIVFKTFSSWAKGKLTAATNAAVA